MASTARNGVKSVKVITRDNAQEGLYKYNTERVVTVESKSNIEKGQLKNFPNHNIGARVGDDYLSFGGEFKIAGTTIRSVITNLHSKPSLGYSSVLSKGYYYNSSILTGNYASRLPFYANETIFTEPSLTIGNLGYVSTKTNTIQQDACRFKQCVVFGNTFFTTTGSITIPINTSQSAKDKPFSGITYVGELNSGENIAAVIDRMQPENKTLYRGTEVNNATYYPENLPFILIATNKKVDLTTGNEVTFERFVQIADAVFQETSAITDRWQKKRGYPQEVNLTPYNISYTAYFQLSSLADSDGKVHLYGLMLHNGPVIDTTSYVKNYIQLTTFADYFNEAKSNTTRIGSSQTTDTYLRGTVHSNGSFVTDSDERIKRKDKLVTTRADGIEVWKFTYHSNGKTELGWIAQQVEEVLRAKSYEQDVIDLAITTASGVDYNASLSKLNAAMGTSYDLFADAEKAHADWLYGKFTAAGGSEATLDEFREAIEKIPYESLTEWQKSTMQMLDENSLESFSVWANDIKSINKQVVLDLLQGV